VFGDVSRVARGNLEHRALIGASAKDIRTRAAPPESRRFEKLLQNLRPLDILLRAYPTTVSERIILAPARVCRLSEEVQGWTNAE
jgi:hypothetical protein